VAPYTGGRAAVTLRLRLADGPPTEIASEWRRLYIADVNATPFSSLEWGSAWAAHLAGGARPHVLLAEAGSDVVGLIPLVQRRRGPFRTLEMLGEGPADYWDILAEPDSAGAVREAFSRWLTRNAARWDAWVIKGVVEGSATEQAVRRAGLRFGSQPSMIAPRLSLRSSFDEWLAHLPSDRRSNIRRRARRLVEAGASYHRIGTTDDVPASVQRWQALRERQWASRGQRMTALHRSARFRSFITDLVIAMLPTGEVVFRELRVDGAVIGSYIDFADATTVYSYLGGFDPSLARLGIGTVATADAIREGIESGRSCFDFLIGQEHYKYWFVPDEERAVLFTAAGTRRLRSRVALAAVNGFVAARSGLKRASGRWERAR
jgi:CelD/BcsL family acetyltransferase involved in cellulose biosynthesis